MREIRACSYHKKQGESSIVVVAWIPGRHKTKQWNAGLVHQLSYGVMISMYAAKPMRNVVKRHRRTLRLAGKFLLTMKICERGKREFKLLLSLSCSLASVFYLQTKKLEDEEYFCKKKKSLCK